MMRLLCLSSLAITLIACSDDPKTTPPDGGGTADADAVGGNDGAATDGTPTTDGASALRVLRILNAAQESLLHDGRPVRFEADLVQTTVSRRAALSRGTAGFG